MRLSNVYLRLISFGQFYFTGTDLGPIADFVYLSPIFDLVDSFELFQLSVTFATNNSFTGLSFTIEGLFIILEFSYILGFGNSEFVILSI